MLPEPSNVVFLDFETYYAPGYALRSMPMSEYVRDPRFEVIGAAFWDAANGREPVWATGFAEVERLLKRIDWANTCLVAHNAHFEALVLSHHFGIRPGLISCTLSLANLTGVSELVGAGLKDVAYHLNVGEKGDEVDRAYGKRLKDFSKTELAVYGEYCKQDCRLTRAVWNKLAPLVPDVEHAVVDFTVKMFSEPVVLLDRAMLEEEAAREKIRRAELLRRLGLNDGSDLASNPKFATALQRLGVSPPMKISPTTKKETFALAKSDPGMQALQEHPSEEVRLLVEARLAVKSTINESRIGRMLTLGAHGPAPIFLKVAAAHTQRWGGGDKTNFQNLPRGGVIRKAIMAPPGHVLVACDSAQIEARGLAWASGQRRLTHAFQEGRDVYSEFASVAYGRKVDRKKVAEDKQPGQVGKVSVLGLGYGMGWRKMAAMLLAGPMGGEPIQFDSVIARSMGVSPKAFETKFETAVRKFVTRLPYEEILVHCAVTKHLVDTYREENPEVVAFWRRCDMALQSLAGERPPMVLLPGFIASEGQIERPSGLSLNYHNMKKRVFVDVDEETSEETKSYRWSYLGGHAGKQVKPLYGGLATENLIQAMCRDIIAEQAVTLRWRYGYKIVTTTHDEVVICVPEKDGDAAKKHMLEVMRTPPDWAKGLPLNAEAGVAVRYGEAK